MNTDLLPCGCRPAAIVGSGHLDQQATTDHRNGCDGPWRVIGVGIPPTLPNREAPKPVDWTAQRAAFLNLAHRRHHRVLPN
jgi:hypothetical protein